jgi:acetate kinase
LRAYADQGEEWSSTAIEVFCYRVKKYIGAYAAAMGGVDAIAFAGGIGENDPNVRAMSTEGLEFLGIGIDPERNNARGVQKVISTPASQVTVIVVPTNEELMIAKDTLALCRSTLAS